MLVWVYAWPDLSPDIPPSSSRGSTPMGCCTSGLARTTHSNPSFCSPIKVSMILLPILQQYSRIPSADVVPVNPQSVDEWTHPPFSGHFDGMRVEAIVGRILIEDPQAKGSGAEAPAMIRAGSLAPCTCYSLA